MIDLCRGRPSVAPEVFSILKAILTPMAYEGGFFNYQGPALFVLPAIVGTLVLFVGSLVWLYRDAERRIKQGIIAILFVLVTGWPASFIWWLWLRPSPTAMAKQ